MTKKKIVNKPTKYNKPKTESKVILECGCGQNKVTPESAFQMGLINQEDVATAKVIGVDMYDCKGVDKVWDLTKFPYPFKDESIDAVFSNHFLEHLDGEQRIKFFNEMYRILKAGGKMRHCHPHYNSVRAIQDPTHKWPPICPQSYMYWDKNWREANKLGHYLGNCDFEFQVYNSGWMSPEWENKNEEMRNFAITYYTNVIADLIVDMKKR